MTIIDADDDGLMMTTMIDCWGGKDREWRESDCTGLWKSLSSHHCTFYLYLVFWEVVYFVFWYLGDVLFDWSPSVVIFMAKPQLILIMIVFDILPVIEYNHGSSFAF